MNFDEQNIIERCRKNDRLAQEQLYRRFFAPMMRLCMRYTRGDRERALEILNNGMLRVFQKIDSFEGRGSLEGGLESSFFMLLATIIATNLPKFSFLKKSYHPKHIF